MNVIDLAAYREKRRIQTQQLQRETPIRTTREITNPWGFFVTTYQLLFPIKRKDE